MPATLAGSILLLFTMNPAPAPFNQLLEEYIFKVANQQIGSAEPSLQTELLALWQTVRDTAKPDESFTESLLPQPSEWDAVLEKPIDWRSVNRQWLQQLIEERSQQHEKYLIRLKLAIEKTQLHLSAVKRSPLPEHSRARQLSNFQYILHMYQQQSVKAERLRDRYLADLNRRKR